MRLPRLATASIARGNPRKRRAAATGCDRLPEDDVRVLFFAARPHWAAHSLAGLSDPTSTGQ